MDEQHEEARASGALLLSLGILPLRKGHKQEADLLGPNNASRLSNAHAHAHVPGPRNAWWHPPAPRNACSPSVTAGSGHSKDSQHVFPKRGERGGLLGHLNLFGLSNWTKRLEADPRGRSICFSSGQSGSLCGNTIDCKHFMGPATS